MRIEQNFGLKQQCADASCASLSAEPDDSQSLPERHAMGMAENFGVNFCGKEEFGHCDRKVLGFEPTSVFLIGHQMFGRPDLMRR